MSNPTEKVYYGKAENKKDPSAKLAPASSKPKPTGRKPPPARAAQLPGPTKPTPPTSKDLKESAPHQDAIFAKQTDLYEIATHTEFTPKMSAFNSIVSSMYETYLSKNVLTSKVLSPGMLKYFAACMAWCRIISLKKANLKALTPTEREILELIQEVTFNLPRPLAIYLKTYGNITSATGETLHPSFPDYPVDQGHSLWADEIDLATHENFETLPTVGVAAECVLEELQAAPPANWNPTVVPANSTPTSNLQGYSPPTAQRSEVRQIIAASGAVVGDINSSIEGADFNIQLLQSTSNAIGRLEVFKNEPTVFSRMEPNGHASQLVKLVPTPSNRSNVLGQVQPYDYTNDSAGTVGMAITFAPNIVREGPLANNQYLGWSCLRNSAPANPVVTAAWVANRNDLRIYPPQYDVNVFTTGARNASSFRSEVIQDLSN